MTLFLALPAADPEPYDVLIVGGGAAGLTLANELDGRGLRVAVLEAGGLKPHRSGSRIFEGELGDQGHHPELHHYRVRALGGASRIWGGRCIPYDPIDFERRPWVSGPGWPFGREVLDPYYVRAQVAAEAGTFDYDPTTALPGRPADLAPGIDGDEIQTRLERFSKPTNFWARFGKTLAASRQVDVFLNAATQQVHLAPSGATVDHIEVAAPDGRRLKFRAKRYVLALGGLETVRLMLASDSVRPGGVGNHSDQLGRGYMSHMAATSGTITFNGPPAAVNWAYEKDAEGVYVRRRLAVAGSAQRRLKSLNTIFRTHLPDPADPAHGDAILSSMYLVKNLVRYEYSRKFRDRMSTTSDFARHIVNVARGPVALARFGTVWVRDRILAERKLPSVALGSRQNSFALEFHAEQEPNPDSRLTLTGATDALGMRRLKVDWRTSRLDTESLKASYALLAGRLDSAAVGRLDYDPDHVADQALREGAYGGHHLGAARMSISPADGVVDPDCRVHGVDNLYLASGAVLPTSSQANPTLTILALTLRLADKLGAEFG